MRKIAMLTLTCGWTVLAAGSARAQCTGDQYLAPVGDPVATFGNAIAVDGPWAAIGANQDYNDNRGFQAPYAVPQFKTGSVFIMHFEQDKWRQRQKIDCPDRNRFGGDEFGHSVAMQGNTLLIGAPMHEGQDLHRGAAYVYELIDSTWTLVDTFSVEEPGGREYFGYAVALDGDVAAISATGAQNSEGLVYIFERIDGVWTQVAQVNGAATGTNDRLGMALSVQNGTVLAGASEAASGYGAAWVFEKVNDEWVETAHLLPSDPESSGAFGRGVCLDGDEALIGGRQSSGPGRVYVYRRELGVWNETESSSFSIFDLQGTSRRFGARIAVRGDTALIAAPSETVNSGSGAAYLFRRMDGAWVQGPRLIASRSEVGDQFADAIALTDTDAWVNWRDHIFGDQYGGQVHVIDVADCRPTLEIISPCPYAGALRLSWTNATPGGMVAIFFSPQTGQSSLPPGGPCEGVSLDLDPRNLQLAYMGDAGVQGNRSVTTQVSQRVCGGYMQLLNILTCSVSDPVQVD
ncbi:MAG: hypothetical protein IT430_04060 [Phycisphaerales bacterium]|nr:hypothetical protein [Phycisphaerales bacterium]